MSSSNGNNNKPLIGILLGASRQGRLSEVPAHWIHALACQRPDLRVELVDIGQHSLPFFEANRASDRGRPRPASQHWNAALERLDGFVVVVPGDDPLHIARQAAQAGAQKRALLHKPVGFVGYGKQAGMPNVHALRSLASALRMAPMSREVHLGLHEVMGVWQMAREFDDFPHLGRAAQDMLDELSWWAHALRAARSRPAPATPAPRWPAAPLAWLRGKRQQLHRWVGGAHASGPSLMGGAADGAASWPR